MYQSYPDQKMFYLHGTEMFRHYHDNNIQTLINTFQNVLSRLLLRLLNLFLLYTAVEGFCILVVYRKTKTTTKATVNKIPNMVGLEVALRSVCGVADKIN